MTNKTELEKAKEEAVDAYLSWELSESILENAIRRGSQGLTYEANARIEFDIYLNKKQKYESLLREIGLRTPPLEEAKNKMDAAKFAWLTHTSRGLVSAKLWFDYANKCNIYKKLLKEKHD